LAAVSLIAVADPCVAQAGGARLEDIATIQGVRSNQLVGYGLVVGLAGTGDSQQVSFTIQSVASMLQKFGVNVPQSSLTMKNVAAVMVTADLPAFAKNGSTIDVTVSSMGDSASLQGGTLLQTPLQAANGQIYAVAQGSVSVGGFSVNKGGGGGSVTQNHVTAGGIPGGAIVEKDVPTTLQHGSDISVSLNQPDFLTAARVATAINENLPQGAIGAHASDAATIDISVSPGTDPIPLIAQLDSLTIVPDTPAKIVIDERTGTVVLGGDVSVSQCAIAHGDLTIQVTNDSTVSQPNPLSRGTTQVVHRTGVNVSEGAEHLIAVPDSPTIDKVVKALNALGVTPRDLIAILQAMKEAGALHADLEVE
jgi:flagellar P-ring protein precursor FlgI